MSTILLIDTAVQSASVCLAKDAVVLSEKINNQQKEQAGWLHTAIKEITSEHYISLSQLDAIAVSAGPGSYTGLRVGMAAAKGLCFALNLPLITVSTLQQMASSANEKEADLLCPMIDARRMEVFTALYNRALETVKSPFNLVLDEDFFLPYLEQQTVLFFGNGSDKFKPLMQHPNARFKTIETTASKLLGLSLKKLEQQDFADLAYAEPAYGKEFFTPVSTKAKSLKS